MLWLCIYCPDILLEYLLQLTDKEPGCAVLVKKMRGVDCVYSVNILAGKQGVKPGMKLAAASAIVADLDIYTYSAEKEQAALQDLACWAMRYTSWVSICHSNAVVLEVAGSLKLFRGIDALFGDVQQQLKTELCYSYTMAVAKTPLGAYWLAKSGNPVIVESMFDMQAMLSALSVRVLALSDRTEQALHEMGMRYVQDLLVLPRDSLVRRFGEEISTVIEKAMGDTKDIPEIYLPNETYRESVALPYPVAKVEAISFVANRLVQAFSRFLLARWQGVREMTLLLQHEHHTDTVLTWRLTLPSRDAEHLLRIIRERMEQTQLSEAVCDMVLCAEQFERLEPEQAVLFADKQKARMPWPLLVDYLQSRLGEKAVCSIAPQEDFRPERAWCAQPPGTVSPVATQPMLRPAWLLPDPVALGKALPTSFVLWRGPERIENGWWDGLDIKRDYYVALENNTRFVWIYWDNKHAKTWYLHGIFS